MIRVSFNEAFLLTLVDMIARQGCFSPVSEINRHIFHFLSCIPIFLGAKI